MNLQLLASSLLEAWGYTNWHLALNTNEAVKLTAFKQQCGFHRSESLAGAKKKVEKPTDDIFVYDAFNSVFTGLLGGNISWPTIRWRQSHINQYLKQVYTDEQISDETISDRLLPILMLTFSLTLFRRRSFLLPRSSLSSFPILSPLSGQ